MRHDFFNRCLVWRIPRELDSVIETIFRVSSRHLSLNHPTVKRLLRASNNLDTSFANYPSLRSIYQKKKKKIRKEFRLLERTRAKSPLPLPLFTLLAEEKREEKVRRDSSGHIYSPRMGSKRRETRRLWWARKMLECVAGFIFPGSSDSSLSLPLPPPSRLAAESRRSANLETSRFGKWRIGVV